MRSALRSRPPTARPRAAPHRLQPPRRGTAGGGHRRLAAAPIVGENNDATNAGKGRPASTTGTVGSRRSGTRSRRSRSDPDASSSCRHRHAPDRAPPSSSSKVTLGLRRFRSSCSTPIATPNRPSSSGASASKEGAQLRVAELEAPGSRGEDVRKTAPVDDDQRSASASRARSSSAVLSSMPRPASASPGDAVQPANDGSLARSARSSSRTPSTSPSHVVTERRSTRAGSERTERGCRRVEGAGPVRDGSVPMRSSAEVGSLARVDSSVSEGSTRCSRATVRVPAPA